MREMRQDFHTRSHTEEPHEKVPRNITERLASSSKIRPEERSLPEMRFPDSAYKHVKTPSNEQMQNHQFTEEDKRNRY